MAIGDETKASWTASVNNAIAIPDASARNAHARALQDGLAAIGSQDRWTDSRSSFWGARTGWDSWATLYAKLRDARNDALTQAGTISPQAAPSSVAGGFVDGFVEGAGEGAAKVAAPFQAVGKGLSDAAKNAGALGWAVPGLVVLVILAAIYRRAA